MELNPELDRRALRAAYARHRKVQVSDFLQKQAAEHLLKTLTQSRDWRLHVNQEKGDKIFELLPEVLASLGRERLEQFNKSVYAQARWGFQFCFEAIRAQPGNSDADPLRQFLELMSSEPTLELVRFITGSDQIDFADAQATAYGPGHFLTAHNDSNPGQRRIAAYVLNLTPTWRLAWGGMLQFHGEDGNIESGWAPGFNVLNLFSVPQPHSVSFVTPFAAYKRYSVTGWFRSRPSPEEPAAEAAS